MNHFLSELAEHNSTCQTFAVGIDKGEAKHLYMPSIVITEFTVMQENNLFSNFTLDFEIEVS